MADFAQVVGPGGTTHRDLTPEEIAQRDTDRAAYEQRLAARQAAAARENTYVADTERADLLNRLRSATPAEIDAYIDNNVANLAQARTVLKRILKILALNVRR